MFMKGYEDQEKQILTKTQQDVLKKMRRSGTKGFSRNDYHVLQTIRRRCRETLKHYNAAKRLFIEIDELMRG